MKHKAAILNNGSRVKDVYGSGRLEQVAELTTLYPEIVSGKTFDEHLPGIADTEVVFSTWGMPPLTAEQIAMLPKLRAVFYAAGSVKNFATPFLEKDIKVVSAWAANGVPVAGFTLSQILLATKRYFQNLRVCETSEGRSEAGSLGVGRGAYGETVALLGAGMIGRKVIELLKPFELNVIVVDPYLSDEKAEQMGVEKATLEEAFATAYVVSCHLPNIDSTAGILNGKLFDSMRENATFINTGRGLQVVESELIEVLKRRSDLTALLDVTYPEPPAADSEFYGLPNVFMSSHIAGSIGDEVMRQADYVIEEYKRWANGEDLKYSVTLEMLKTMA